MCITYNTTLRRLSVNPVDDRLEKRIGAVGVETPCFEQMEMILQILLILAESPTHPRSKLQQRHQVAVALVRVDALQRHLDERQRLGVVAEGVQCCHHATERCDNVRVRFAQYLPLYVQNRSQDWQAITVLTVQDVRVGRSQVSPVEEIGQLLRIQQKIDGVHVRQILLERTTALRYRLRLEVSDEEFLRKDDLGHELREFVA